MCNWDDNKRIEPKPKKRVKQVTAGYEVCASQLARARETINGLLQSLADAAQRERAYRAEVRDLKARVRSARSVSKFMQERGPSELLKHITDLKNKKWRES